MVFHRFVGADWTNIPLGLWSQDPSLRRYGRSHLCWLKRRCRVLSIDLLCCLVLKLIRRIDLQSMSLPRQGEVGACAGEERASLGN